MLDESIFDEFPVLETVRLRMQAIDSADIPALYRLFSDPEVCRYYDLEPLTDESGAVALVKRFADRYADDVSIRWGITLKPSDALIGTCGLYIHSDWRGAIGYDLLPAYWGQGIMTEAVSELTRFGFEDAGLVRLEAFVMLENVASDHLLKKIGYVEEGVLRQYMYIKGQMHDMRCFSLVSAEYEQIKRT